MSRTTEGKEVDITTASTLFNIGLGAAVSYLGWDKRQDKLKLKEHDQDLAKLRVDLARQDERTKGLADDVCEIKTDTKDIIRLLMEKH